MKKCRAWYCNDLERGEAEYLIAWDDFPEIKAWYLESTLEEAE